jgi:site-specific recombinase XerD
MSTLLAEPVTFDPLKNKAYRLTGLGRDIADFLAWKDLGGASPKTLLNYEPDLARGALMFPLAVLNHEKALEQGIPMPTGAYTFGDSEMIQVSQSFPPASRRVRTASWRSFYKWAIKTRRVTVNPCDALPDMRSKPASIPTVFSVTEVEALLGAREARDRACMAILFDAGLRRAEACNLRLRDCYPDTGQLLVLNGKGGRDRIIPMSARLVAALDDVITLDGVNHDDFMFYTEIANDQVRYVRRQKPMGEASWSRWWKRCLTDAGVRYRKPHAARHTFATSLRRQGLAIDDLKKLMGHASILTTESIYTHSTIHDVADRMREIGAIS